MEYYLCADLGGTNASVGLVSVSKEKDANPHFSLLQTLSYKTIEFSRIDEILEQSLVIFRKEHSFSEQIPINISACGPTDGQTCQPTNLDRSWGLNKNELTKKFNTRVYLINDFAANAYSLMTLESHNDSKTIHIPRSPEGIFAPTQENIKLILGAGTGLGCATIHCKDKTGSLISSEAGWLDFAPDLNNIYEGAYARFLSGTHDINAQRPAYSWEDALSASRGINNIFSFFCDEKHSDDIISSVQRKFLSENFLRESPYSRPALISQHALSENSPNNPCISIMKFWVVLYARYARQMALCTLPTGGLFLGGGAATKNLSFFLEQDLFKNIFTTHGNPHIKELLERVPLYIIDEYLISLYGNAYHLYMRIEEES